VQIETTSEFLFSPFFITCRSDLAYSDPDPQYYKMELVPIMTSSTNRALARLANHLQLHSHNQILHSQFARISNQEQPYSLKFPKQTKSILKIWLSYSTNPHKSKQSRSLYHNQHLPNKNSKINSYIFNRKLNPNAKINTQIKKLDSMEANLQDAVTIASVAEILEAEVALAFRELVAESLLQLGARGTH
jgi:hypothetical protein